MRWITSASEWMLSIRGPCESYRLLPRRALFAPAQAATAARVVCSRSLSASTVMAAIKGRKPRRLQPRPVTGQSRSSNARPLSRRAEIAEEITRCERPDRRRRNWQTRPESTAAAIFTMHHVRCRRHVLLGSAEKMSISAEDSGGLR
jgi:hypothetical protein